MPTRTTVTLDDDLRAQLEAEMRKTGESFKETVNETLRTGLFARQKAVRNLRDSGLGYGSEARVLALIRIGTTPKLFSVPRDIEERLGVVAVATMLC